MAFNKDEMHAPTWMDKQFFERVLRHSESDSTLTVDGFKITPGSNAGDHFASIIFRAVVEYKSRGDGKDHEMSLIIKTMPAEEGLKKDMIKDGTVFETETLIYNTVLPEMYRLLREAGDDTVIGPRLLYTSKDPQWVMVFADLCTLGYATKSRQLDLIESKMLYSKLAKFHAASLYLVESLPVMKTLDKGVGNLSNPGLIAIWKQYIVSLSKAVRGWPGFESYSELLEKVSEKIFDKFAEIYTYSDSSRYHILNHGDAHFRNYMYKIVDGKTEDIMLLDFQICIWGTPAIDILYSMYNTVSVETRDNYRDELIKFYYDEFAATLNKFGYLKKIPTLVDLYIETAKCGHLETFIVTTFLPFMILSMSELLKDAPQSEEGVEFNFDDKSKMEEVTAGIYRHPKIAATLQKYLPMLLHKGLLDL